MGETFKSVRTCKQRFIDEYKDHVMHCDKDVLSISSFKSKFAWQKKSLILSLLMSDISGNDSWFVGYTLAKRDSVIC